MSRSKPQKSGAERERRRRVNSSLSEHKRTGKVLKSPMNATLGTTLRAVGWAREILPNYLWICHHISSGSPNDGLLLVGHLLDRIQSYLDGGEFPGAVELVSGRLTDFEATAGPARARILQALASDGLYEECVPEEFAHALGMYPSAPGRWLIQPWLERGLSISPQIAEESLRATVAPSLDGQGEVSTRAKSIAIRHLIYRGRIHLPPGGLGDAPGQDGEMLSRWPVHTSADENALIEPLLRSMFGAVEQLEDDDTKARVTSWCQDFWRSNWKLFLCESHPGFAPGTLTDADVEAIGKAASTSQDAMRELWSRFRSLAGQTDPDLFNPDRCEVLTGLVGRILRAATAFAEVPAFWSMEHGAPLVRAAVETRIMIKYIEQSHDPAALYSRFKAYGRGHLKLLKLHLEQYTDEEDNPSPETVAYLKYLNALVNQDLMEEFQDIDIGGNFAGVDLRKMSDTVGMGREYRLLFAPASSNVHGEWSVIDEHVLERCANPLHLGHRILASEDARRFGPTFMAQALRSAQQVVDEYADATATQRGTAPPPTTPQGSDADDNGQATETEPGPARCAEPGTDCAVTPQS